TKVPVYPNAYAIYKTDGFALSFGFGPNAGGGSAEYEKGLPSFETPISMLPLMISAAGLPTSRYSAQISFEGESIFYGFKANASFALSDAVAVAGGVRYIYAVNKYEGSLTNILVNSYHPLLNPTQQMIPAKTLVGAQAADKSVDVKQVGSGITPIVGLSLTPAQNLKIGVRYEFNTKIELENETAKDDLGAYPDGRKERSDIPPVFAVGAEYGLSPNVRASVSYTLFLEKQANWEGREETLDGNSYDLALGLEFDLTKAVTLSGGYIYSRSGAREKYQLDTSYDLDSDTYGAGLRIRLGSSVDLDLGGIYVKYKDQVKKMAVPFYGAYEEKYKQKTTGFGIGLNFHL
ncbi:MAG TPA: outer membrane beta-barrel protein, partial [Candidatus Aminicenantes bacterium]|nr:outer membrane beta-barrel protein [Candidatus Aminicenantes bacterium]